LVVGAGVVLLVVVPVLPDIQQMVEAMEVLVFLMVLVAPVGIRGTVYWVGQVLVAVQAAEVEVEEPAEAVVTVHPPPLVGLGEMDPLVMVEVEVGAVLVRVVLVLAGAEQVVAV
jgi:hypothetical protein